MEPGRSGPELVDLVGRRIDARIENARRWIPARMDGPPGPAAWKPETRWWKPGGAGTWWNPVEPGARQKPGPWNGPDLKRWIRLEKPDERAKRKTGWI